MDELEQYDLEQENAIEPDPESVTVTPQEPAHTEEAAPERGEEFWRRQAHIERSNLGRKVKSLAENMLTRDDLKSFLEEFNRTNGRRVEEEYEEDLIPDDPKALRKFIRNEVTRANQPQTTPQPQVDRYSEHYVDELNELVWEIEDEGIRTEVYDLLTKDGSPFNKRLSDNPTSDCGKNFARALASVTKDKRAAPKTPFQGKGAPVPAGVTTPSQGNRPVKKAPKLDDIAAEYARTMGMSEEEVIKAMEGDISPGLSPKF